MVNAAIDALRTGSIDHLFIGFGLHRLVRAAGTIQGPTPYQHSTKFWQSNLARLANASRTAATSRAVTLVGALPVDAEVILLHPAKRDYTAFHDFAWQRLHSLLERRLMREHARDVNYLPLDDLAAACPGTRCDGVHWSADFPPPHFGCYSNIALLIDFFSSWLEARGVLRGGVEPPPLCSNFTRWIDRCPRSAPKRHLGGRTKPVCTCLDAAAPVKGAHYEWQV